MLRTCLLILLFMPLTARAQQKTPEQKVREDKTKVEAEAFWIYNDITRGFAEAERTGKPLLVVLRCIPCEECVQLDDELMDQDPVVRPLLEKFVCIRQVSTNGLDLSLFQFDTDQSFAVFMLNADRSIYGRFGTRSHRTDWVGDVSLIGLAKALEGALELHAQYPANKSSLAGKHGPQPLFASPEKYPLLKDKYTGTLNYSDNVAQSCIHCHQIGNAQLKLFRQNNRKFSEELLYPYPHPKTVGLILDPRERAKVLEVETHSPAADSGFRPGDRIQTLDGQPMLSTADVQWVLHAASPSGAQIPVDVDRNGQRRTLTLTLPDGWRSQDDISWRPSTFALVRMTLGEMRLETTTPEEKAALNLDADRMALRVTYDGGWERFSLARKVGFKRGDVVTSYDGRTDLLTEADVLRYSLNHRKPGENVALTVFRDGQQHELTLPMRQ